MTRMAKTVTTQSLNEDVTANPKYAREVEVMRTNADKFGYPQPELTITAFGGYRYIRAVCPTCKGQPLIRGYNQHYSRLHAHPETVKRGEDHPNRIKAVKKQREILEHFDDVDYVGELKDWKRRSDASLSKILANQKAKGFTGTRYA